MIYKLDATLCSQVCGGGDETVNVGRALADHVFNWVAGFGVGCLISGTTMLVLGFRALSPRQMNQSEARTAIDTNYKIPIAILVLGGIIEATVCARDVLY